MKYGTSDVDVDLWISGDFHGDLMDPFGILTTAENNGARDQLCTRASHINPPVWLGPGLGPKLDLTR